MSITHLFNNKLKLLSPSSSSAGGAGGAGVWEAAEIREADPAEGGLGNVDSFNKSCRGASGKTSGDLQASEIGMTNPFCVFKVQVLV
jgi:hypothetical protein